MKKPHVGPKILIGICLLVGLIILCIPKKKNYTYTTQEGTLERNIEAVFLKTIGQPVILISKEPFSQGGKNDTGLYFITINYRPSTLNGSKTLILDEALKFFPKFFADSRFNNIMAIGLCPYLILTDKYGKQSEEQVATMMINRTVASKINWSNMDFGLFEKLLSSEGLLWFHVCLED